jgi:hypothetical protein
MMTNTDLLMTVLGGFCFGGLFLILLVVGIILIIRFRRDRQKAVQSLNWPSVPGVVVESRIDENRSTDTEGDISITYRPYVRYEYQVGGETFSSDKLYIGLSNYSSNRQKAQQTTSQNPVGAAVNVYYNPENHGDAVLQQKTGGSAALVVGIILLVVGVCGLCGGSIFLATSIWNMF